MTQSFTLRGVRGALWRQKQPSWVQSNGNQIACIIQILPHNNDTLPRLLLDACLPAQLLSPAQTHTQPVQPLLTTTGGPAVSSVETQRCCTIEVLFLFNPLLPCTSLLADTQPNHCNFQTPQGLQKHLFVLRKYFF